MSSNYTGSATTSQPPSPAPGPGVSPIVNEPSDGDGLNAASVAQMAKTPADYLAYVNKSVWLSPPRVPASASSGYTAVTYSAFGGTVTPSGDGTVGSTTGTNFLIQIVAGGAVGVATYKISSDGGATFGGTHATAASLTDLDTGITLAFAGTLTTNGTAQFFSALTAQLQIVDTSSNVRTNVDNNGYLIGRISSIDEQWVFTGTFNADQLPVPDYARLNMKVSGGNLVPSSPLVAAPFMPTRHMQFQLGGAAGNFLGVATNGAVLSGILTGISPAHDFIVAVLEFEFAMSAVGSNNSDWFLGFSDTYNFTGATSANGIFFQKKKTDTNWQCGRYSGSSGFNLIDSGIAPVANTPNRFKIEMHAKNTPVGSGTGAARWFIDGKLRAAATTNLTLPVANPSMLIAFYGDTVATASADTGYLSPWTFVMNRYASVGPL